ncbi:MAG: hypothetical protein ACJ76X_12170 [Solirubrobacteraceae bacterium]|jgi:hypothetical protein
MRRLSFGILAVTALAASGCGGGTTFANKPRPPAPVNLTVYVSNSRVSVSPTSVGAGPVVFIVTNSADQTESITIQTSDGVHLASTGPVNPQSTAQVTVDFRDPGTYTVNAGRTGGSTQASQHQPSTIAAATIRIGKQRPSASDQLLQP